LVYKRKKGAKMKVKKLRPQTRYLEELKEVVYDKEWFKGTKNFPLYYILRGVKEKGELRYDITIIPSRMLGKEFVKTKGHYHLGNFGELYKVLSGEGIFLIQKKDLSDAYFVKAKKGDFIKIPPGYGHTIINPSKKVLKIANWVSKNCQSDYQTIEKKNGFCYYYTIEGWVKNKNYKKIPKLKRKKPSKKMPKSLKFLFG
jgi:glucose-6-phosphate isomerase